MIQLGVTMSSLIKLHLQKLNNSILYYIYMRVLRQAIKWQVNIGDVSKLSEHFVFVDFSIKI